MVKLNGLDPSARRRNSGYWPSETVSPVPQAGKRSKNIYAMIATLTTIVSMGIWGVAEGVFGQHLPISPSLLDKAFSWGDVIIVDTRPANLSTYAFRDLDSAETYVLQTGNGPYALRHTETLSNGAIPIKRLKLRLEIEGNRFQPVQISAVRVEIVERSQPVALAAVCPHAIFMQPNSSTSIDKLDFNLDDPSPQAMLATDGVEAPSQRFFDHKAITLTRHERQSFWVNFHTEYAYVRFSIAIDYVMAALALNILVPG